jgi:hypothetical protein
MDAALVGPGRLISDRGHIEELVDGSRCHVTSRIQGVT